jgi:hypothetical protein
MSAIWKRDESGWKLLSPSGFPDEETLHSLVEQAPNMLPLAGSPRLTVVGREVLLGGNWADLIAVDSTGQLAIIEVKLGKSAEARRAVIAQILTYAAFLRGMAIDTLEGTVLASHLAKRGFSSLSHAVSSEDQDGSFDSIAFMDGLETSLLDGSFRLILVLDEAPPELVRLVGYLEAVTDKLSIDLVVVSAFLAGGAELVVPQRVEAAKVPTTISRQPPAPPSPKGQYIPGAEAFLDTTSDASPVNRQVFDRLVAWARSLESEGLIKLGSYLGISGRATLLPRLTGYDAGLVTIWNDNGPVLSVWRSVFEKLAPASLARIEKRPNSPKLGQGNYIKDFSEEFLEELTEAYREAARGLISV